jgi:DNA-binding MarR family transcriptional regulator
MLEDFTQCMVSNSRMAARAITRRYDVHLRPYGLTSTQLSLLGAIKALPGRTVSELADARGFERTTLTRNLDRLQAMGFIASHPARKGNGRICEITSKGLALVETLTPVWRRAQAEMKDALTAEGFNETLSVLKRLANV